MDVRVLSTQCNLIRSIDICTPGYNKQWDERNSTEVDRNLPRNATIKSRLIKKYGDAIGARSLDMQSNLVRSIDICTPGCNKQWNSQNCTRVNRDLRIVSPLNNTPKNMVAL